MDINLYSGDSRNLIISVIDENSAVVPLTGATIEWALVQNSSIVLSKTIGKGIVLNNATGGQFTVEIFNIDTRTLSGTYQQFARVTTIDGNSSMVLTGTVTILESMI